MPQGLRPIAEFGRDRRSLRLAQVLFGLCLEHGDSIHEGWTNVVHALLWMRQLDLLPKSLLELDDFRDSAGKPLDSLRPVPGMSTAGRACGSASERACLCFAEGESQPKKEEGGRSYGFLSSALSLILPSVSVAEDELKPHPTEAGGEAGAASSAASEEEQYIRSARDCISACQLSELFVSIGKYLNPSALSYLLRALMLVSSFGTSRTPAAVIDVFHRKVINEEAAVFALERVAAIFEKRIQTSLKPVNPSRASSLTDLKAAAASSNQKAATTQKQPSAAGAAQPSTPADRALAYWAQFEAHFESALKNCKPQPTFYMGKTAVRCKCVAHLCSVRLLT
jgi:hypothetical protein